MTQLTTAGKVWWGGPVHCETEIPEKWLEIMHYGEPAPQ